MCPHFYVSKYGVQIILTIFNRLEREPYAKICPRTEGLPHKQCDTWLVRDSIISNIIILFFINFGPQDHQQGPSTTALSFCTCQHGQCFIKSGEVSFERGPYYDNLTENVMYNVTFFCLNVESASPVIRKWATTQQDNFLSQY